MRHHTETFVGSSCFERFQSSLDVILEDSGVVRWILKVNFKGLKLGSTASWTILECHFKSLGDYWIPFRGFQSGLLWAFRRSMAFWTPFQRLRTVSRLLF
ncbi:hypothetical protein C1645_881044 [Glomus cerebriforme]|uniref:Uncharacterized protein n=1 Tax=Glomus cerebriforme TaxID=658196 RepID=A0A397S902_9GLOM|nr:hypothetical protein C1645_881044 [Glomus cerebriforme]